MRYTSSTRLLGLPLVEIVLPSPTPPGTPPEGFVARGWLAIGPAAVGAVAFGGLAVGGFALGGFALGLLGIGGLAAGGLALGGGAIGYWAAGGGALAVQAAFGGLAVSGRYAIGGAAFAPHANDREAVDFLASGIVLPAFRWLSGHATWLLVLPALLLLAAFLVPSRRPRRPRSGGDSLEPG